MAGETVTRRIFVSYGGDGDPNGEPHLTSATGDRTTIVDPDQARRWDAGPGNAGAALGAWGALAADDLDSRVQYLSPDERAAAEHEYADWRAARYDALIANPLYQFVLRVAGNLGYASPDRLLGGPMDPAFAPMPPVLETDYRATAARAAHSRLVARRQTASDPLAAALISTDRTQALLIHRIDDANTELTQALVQIRAAAATDRAAAVDIRQLGRRAPNVRMAQQLLGLALDAIGALYEAGRGYAAGRGQLERTPLWQAVLGARGVLNELRQRPGAAADPDTFWADMEQAIARPEIVQLLHYGEEPAALFAATGLDQPAPRAGPVFGGRSGARAEYLSGTDGAQRAFPPVAGMENLAAALGGGGGGAGPPDGAGPAAAFGAVPGGPPVDEVLAAEARTAALLGNIESGGVHASREFTARALETRARVALLSRPEHTGRLTFAPVLDAGIAAAARVLQQRVSPAIGGGDLSYLYDEGADPELRDQFAALVASSIRRNQAASDRTLRTGAMLAQMATAESSLVQWFTVHTRIAGGRLAMRPMVGLRGW